VVGGGRGASVKPELGGGHRAAQGVRRGLEEVGENPFFLQEPVRLRGLAGHVCRGGKMLRACAQTRGGSPMPGRRQSLLSPIARQEAKFIKSYCQAGGGVLWRVPRVLAGCPAVAGCRGADV